MNKRTIIFLMLVLLLACIDEAGEFKMLKGSIDLIENYKTITIVLPERKENQLFSLEADALVSDFTTAHNVNNGILIFEGKPKTYYLDNGNKLTKLLDEMISNPSFSPNNKTLAYLKAKDVKIRAKKPRFFDWRLYAMDMGAHREKSAFDLSLTRNQPSWFPGSKKVVVSTKDYSVYVVRIDDMSAEKIIDFGYAPSVSHDGKKILYLSQELSPETEMLRKYKMATEKEANSWEFIINGTKVDEYEFSKYMLKWNIFMYDVDTGTSKRITDKMWWIESTPIWSPDDKFIVFSDRRYVSDDIYVLNVQSTDIKRLGKLRGRIVDWRD